MWSGAFLGFADGGGGNEARRAGPRREAEGLRCEARRAESGGGVLGEGAASRQTVLLHFKYSGWPLLTPFLRFF